MVLPRIDDFLQLNSGGIKILLIEIQLSKKSMRCHLINSSRFNGHHWQVFNGYLQITFNKTINFINGSPRNTNFFSQIKLPFRLYWNRAKPLRKFEIEISAQEPSFS